MRSLVEILQKDLKAVTGTQIRIAENERRRTGEKLEEALCRLGFIKEETVAQALGLQYQLPVITRIHPEEVDLVWLSEHASWERAKRSKFLPLRSNGRRSFVVVNPADFQLFDFIESVEGHTRTVALTTEKSLSYALEALNASLSTADLERLVIRGELEGAEGDAIETLVDSMLHEAIKKNATDLHIEPTQHTTQVYLRIDGARRPFVSLPKALHQSVTNLIKVRADIKSDQHFTPDDKKFTFTHLGRTIDIRVSLLPSVWGPAIVNRILDKMATLITLEDLGYSQARYDSIDKLSRSPNGLMLVTGPTGSGKTTTLYALLSKIASPEKKTITVEDPVEYTIPCVTQCQVRDDRGFSFSRALRSILRHDPDIIMVGEIRDRETARIAIEASLTGHLVLSTLHTISALATIVRLMDMDISTDDIASTLRAVIAQRLVRKLCADCKKEGVLPDGIVERHGLESNRAWEARGCDGCALTGYQGRTVVAEVLTVDDEIAEMICERRSAGAIRQRAMEKGFSPMSADALKKVTSGVTDLKEVEKVIGAI